MVELGRSWQYNRAHTLHMLGNLRQEYRHTLRIRITYCFSTATVVMQTCHSVTLPLHCWRSVCHWLPGQEQIIQKVKLQAVAHVLWGPLFVLWLWKGGKSVYHYIQGIAIAICTHMTFCWNTPGLFSTCPVYCKTCNILHLHLFYTLLYYKHKTVWESAFPVLFIFNNGSPPTAY
jgi:hypothetical protein